LKRRNPDQNRSKKNIVLTRKTGHNDGFGAQLQRILGVYCICKEYNLKYFHTPMVDIGYQGVTALQANKNSQQFVDECNNRFNPDSDISFEDIVHYKKIDENLNKSQLDNVPENTLVQYAYPYCITDKYPEIYRHAKDIFKTRKKKNSVFTIGMHVRRGELFVVNSDRMLPNSFYIGIARRIVRICKNYNIECIVELYTDMPVKSILVTPDHPGISNRIEKNVKISPSNYQIYEFDQILNLKKYINEELLDTFDRMINSDILIMSRSSLSACASYLKKGISIYHPFWHSMMKRDIAYNDSRFESRLIEYITALNNFPTNKNSGT